MRYFRARVGKPKAGFLACGALLTLALFQFGFAVHQLTHDEADTNEVCVVCSVYNQLDDVPLAAGTSIAIVHSFAANISLPRNEAFANLSQGFLIRAPPAA